MKHSGLLTLIFIIASIVLIFYGINQYKTQNITPTATASLVYEYINNERLNRSLPTLSNDSALTLKAQEWSAHLASTGNVEHGDFTGRMHTIGLPSTSYSCGEIIALNYPDAYSFSSADIAVKLVAQWLNSPQHRDVMLTAKDGAMGVGVACNGTAYYGVVDFKFLAS